MTWQPSFWKRSCATRERTLPKHRFIMQRDSFPSDLPTGFPAGIPSDTTPLASDSRVEPAVEPDLPELMPRAEFLPGFLQAAEEHVGGNEPERRSHSDRRDKADGERRQSERLPLRRIIGTYEDPESQRSSDVRGPGPLFIAIGGVHGNEPAGVRAAVRVLEYLAFHKPSFHGRFVAVAGNLRALERDERYIEDDLNRHWTLEAVERVRSQGKRADSPEDRELREILAVFEQELQGPHERAIFLDLHTSSGQGAPFICMGDTLQNRHISQGLPIPLILGLEEVIRGSMLEYLGEQGHCALAVEGGQHTDARTVSHHEAAIWCALVAAGCLREEDVCDFEQQRDLLRVAAGGLPSVVEILHRQASVENDGFEMVPGFHNFERVHKGDLLATDNQGEICAPLTGRVLLPRYQGQGDDAFFLGRRVSPFWLGVSARLRAMRAERVLHLLPGVKRVLPGAPATRYSDPRQASSKDNRLEVNTRIARFFPAQLMHLFGYRRRTPMEGVVIFERRCEGLPWN